MSVFDNCWTGNVRCPSGTKKPVTPNATVIPDQDPGTRRCQARNAPSVDGSILGRFREYLPVARTTTVVRGGGR